LKKAGSVNSKDNRSLVKSFYLQRSLRNEKLGISAYSDEQDKAECLKLVTRWSAKQPIKVIDIKTIITSKTICLLVSYRFQQPVPARAYEL